MICCKECLELLCDYLDGELDSKVSASLEEHFEDCPPCIAFVNTYKSTTHLCRTTLKNVEIPEVVQARLKEFIEKNKDQ
ncbi:MAG: zf-HC2 domain-containing protein [Nitrospinae bacterium]|nr:zf-HC2 domain-containing protein [Nitrospinota bacterium]